MNATPEGAFSSPHGLSQDPLPPLPFFILMEALSRVRELKRLNWTVDYEAKESSSSRARTKGGQ